MKKGERGGRKGKEGRSERGAHVSHLVLVAVFFAACFNGWLLDFSSNESCSGGAGEEYNTVSA